MWVKSSISNSNSKLLCGSKSHPCQACSWEVNVWMSQQIGSWQTPSDSSFHASSPNHKLQVHLLDFSLLPVKSGTPQSWGFSNRDE